MAGNIGFVCRSFGGGAFAALGGIVVSLAAPYVIDAIRNRMETIKEQQEKIDVVETVDPDLC